MAGEGAVEGGGGDGKGGGGSDVDGNVGVEERLKRLLGSLGAVPRVDDGLHGVAGVEHGAFRALLAHVQQLPSVERTAVGEHGFDAPAYVEAKGGSDSDGDTT